jgi:putative CocE/NonD family hydrolase
MNPRMAFDVRVPMRDGTTLSADVFLPPDGDGPWPGLLNRTPYDNTRHPELAATLACHGYAVAVQDVRGRGDSDGTFDPWLQEFGDGYDSVEWMAGQPWCDGKVGIYGGSYQSYCGWAAARDRPPHLRALVSRATSGISQLGEHHDLGCAPPYWLWFFNLTSGRALQTALDRESPSLNWRRVLFSTPLRDMDAAIGRRIPAWQRFVDARPDDTLAVALDGVFAGLDLPVLHITGWHDAAKWGELRTWRETAAADRHWLVVGPWDHYGTGAPQRQTMGRDFGADSVIDTNAEMLRFFDAQLKGIENGFAEEPRVRYFVMGGSWAESATWPPPAAPTTLYLHAGGLLDTAPPAPDEPRASYRYDPACPTPSTLDLDAPFTSGRELDIRWKLDREDVLTYTSAPLDSLLEIAGQPVVTLFAESDRLDTDFHLALCEVHSDGRSDVITRGFVRSSFRYGPAAPRRHLVPGEVTELTVRLGDTAARIPPGSGVRLVITSADFPDLDRNPNTGAPIGDDTVQLVAMNTIHHSAHHPTRLSLPVPS